MTDYGHFQIGNWESRKRKSQNQKFAKRKQKAQRLFLNPRIGANKRELLKWVLV
jgi:hypothetical protein